MWETVQNIGLMKTINGPLKHEQKKTMVKTLPLPALMLGHSEKQVNKVQMVHTLDVIVENRDCYTPSETSLKKFQFSEASLGNISNAMQSIYLALLAMSFGKACSSKKERGVGRKTFLSLHSVQILKHCPAYCLIFSPLFFKWQSTNNTLNFNSRYRSLTLLIQSQKKKGKPILLLTF